MLVCIALTEKPILRRVRDVPRRIRGRTALPVVPLTLYLWTWNMMPKLDPDSKRYHFPHEQGPLRLCSMVTQPKLQKDIQESAAHAHRNHEPGP